MTATRRQRCAVADTPVRGADANHVPKGFGEAVRHLAAATGTGEAGQQGAGQRTRVEAAGLRVAERVLGQGRRRGLAEQRVRVRERGVEPEQGGEPLAAVRRLRDVRTAEDRRLDRVRRCRNPRIGHPGLALSLELGGIEPLEELTEAVGVVHG